MRSLAFIIPLSPPDQTQTFTTTTQKVNMANPLPSCGLTPSMASRMHKRAETERALYDLNASQALQRQKDTARSDEVEEEVNEDLSQEPYINDARSSSYSLSSDNYKTYSATELLSAAQIYDSSTFDFATGLAGSAHVKLSDDRPRTSSSKIRVPKPIRAMKTRSKSATAMHQAADIEILGTHVPSDIPEGNRPDSPTLPPMLLYPQKSLGPHPSFFATSNPKAPIDGTYHKPPPTLPSASPVSTPAVVYTENSLFPQPHPARHLIHNNLPGANPLLTPELPKLLRREPPPSGRHPAHTEIRGVHPATTSEPPKPLGRYPSYSDLRASDPPRPSQSPSHPPTAHYRQISPEPVNTISAATPGQTYHSQENPSPRLPHRNKHNTEADRTRLHTLYVVPTLTPLSTLDQAKSSCDEQTPPQASSQERCQSRRGGAG